MNNYINADEILNKLDIVDVIGSYINLSKRGKDYIGLCPFHDDHSPSMHVSKEKQIYKCFTCGKGGNLINFISNYENISYLDALYKAADLAGIKVIRNKKVDQFEKEKECMSSLVNYYNMMIELKSGEKARTYCDQRGLNAAIRKQFMIGYAPINKQDSINYLMKCGFSIKTMQDIGICGFENGNYYDKNSGRIIFPITNLDGEFVGLSARKFLESDNGPKYINSPETVIFHKSDILYNFSSAKNYCKKDNFLYIVEGFVDTIALFKANINSCVALMGTALTNEKVFNSFKLLKCEIRLCLDNDDAGQNGEFILAKRLFKEGINFKVVKKSSLAKDSGDIFDKFGKDALLKYLNDLEDGLEFILEKIGSNNLNDNSSKKKFIDDTFEIYSSCSISLDKETLLDKVVSLTGYSKVNIINYWKSKIKNYNNEVSNKKISFSSNNKKEKNSELSKNVKLNKLENNIITYILTNKKALDMFIESDSYFYNNIYSSITFYLQDYYSKFSINDITKIVDFISQESSSNDLSDEIISLYNNGSNNVFDENLFSKKLFDLKIEQRKALLNSKIKSELDEKNKLKYAEELRKILLIEKQHKEGK